MERLSSTLLEWLDSIVPFALGVLTGLYLVDNEKVRKYVYRKWNKFKYRLRIIGWYFKGKASFKSFTWEYRNFGKYKQARKGKV